MQVTLADLSPCGHEPGWMEHQQVLDDESLPFEAAAAPLLPGHVGHVHGDVGEGRVVVGAAAGDWRGQVVEGQSA